MPVLCRFEAFVESYHRAPEVLLVFPHSGQQRAIRLLPGPWPLPLESGAYFARRREARLPADGAVPGDGSSEE